MNAILRRIELKLDGLALRERALILAALLFAMFMAVDTVALRPLRGRSTLAAEARSRLEDEGKTLDGRRSELEGALAQDPRRADRDELARLETELQDVDADLSRRTSELVSPRDMATLLSSVLGSQPAIHVDRLETLPAEPLVPAAPATGQGPASALVDGFYRHTLRIELHATFHETLSFLAVLEKLPASVLWHRLEYRVEQYPRARVVLEIYTLGPREGSVGV
jgi:MSHA biogenesis protein MshJ